MRPSILIGVLARRRAAVSAFDPGNIDGLLQRFLDETPSYYGSTVDRYPIMTPEETYGSIAVPRAGRCFKGDGSDDYGITSSNIGISGATSRTVTFWAKLATTGNQCLVGWGGGSDNRLFTFGVQSANWYFWGYNADTSFGAADTSWHHHAITYNGTQVEWFIDNVSVGTYVATLNTEDSPFTVLRRAALGDLRSAAYIRDIRVYSGVKDSTARTAIYNQSSTPTTLDRTGLLAGWWCEGESKTTERDWSGNGRDLTLTNVDTSTFHATDTAITFSAANSLGHSRWMSINPSGAGNWDSWWLSAEQITGNGYAEFLVSDLYTMLGITSETTFSGENMYVGLDYVLQRIDATTLRFWSNFSSADVTVANALGDRIRFERTGTTVVAKLNGSTVHTFGVGSSATLRGVVAQSVGGSTVPVCVSVNGSSPSTFGGLLVAPAALIIPRNEASTSFDVTGDALQFSGPIAKPATVESPCIAGDGSAVYAVSGSNIGITGAASRTLCWRGKLNSTTGNHTFVMFGEYSGTVFGNLMYENTWAFANATKTSVAADTNWHHHAITYDGTTQRYYLDDVLIGSQTVALNTSATPLYMLAMYWDNATIQWNADGRLCDVRIYSDVKTQAEIQAINAGTDNRTNLVAHWPCQEGPGSSNTNRTIYDTVGTNNLTLTNGTVATIWANRCPYARDWCIEYGGGIAVNGAFVPGRTSSGNDAAGNAKTLTAGKHGNPYSRLTPNRWNVPSLRNIGYTSSTSLAPTDTVQATSPADTKFRRNAADGSDRYVAFLTALTGADKTNMEDYVA